MKIGENFLKIGQPRPKIFAVEVAMFYMYDLACIDLATRQLSSAFSAFNQEFYLFGKYFSISNAWP